MEGNVKELRFKEKPQIMSQQTIVELLKKYKFYFEGVSKYDTENFYCVLKIPQAMSFENWWYEKFKWFGAKRPELKYANRILLLSAGVCNDDKIEEPFVFTREDVLQIYNDLGDNYVGEEEI